MIEVMMKEAGLKNRLRMPILWAVLVLIGLLTVFSVYGAFIGAERALGFFNSIPLTVYWVMFAGVLIAGIALFSRLLHVRDLLLIHSGCVLVLAGGMWGSQALVKTQDSLFGTDTIRAGRMVLYEGQTEKSVSTADMGQKNLPFEIKLVDFNIEYYEPGILLIQTIAGDVLYVKAEPGAGFSIGDDYGSIEIARCFTNFKLILEGDKYAAIDDPNGEPNPAVELTLKRPDGSQVTRYAFERFSGGINLNDKLAFSYRRIIRDFISDIEVIKNKKAAARKRIEVNEPLHFDGYFVYQQGYDDVAGRYTVLLVRSDKGLTAVYLGFVLLSAGLFRHLWFGRVFGKGLSRTD